jgi:calnexin
MKLLKDNKALHAEEFSNTSPYVIMFGPDKCGATNKVSPKAMQSPARAHVE